MAVVERVNSPRREVSSSLGMLVKVNWVVDSVVVDFHVGRITKELKAWRCRNSRNERSTSQTGMFGE